MVGAAFCLAMLIGCLAVWVVTAPRHWRGESRLRGDDPPLWFPFGEPVWRGVVRSYVTWTPFVALFFGGGAVAALSREGADMYDVGMAICCLGLLLGAAVHFPIVFFNRPRFLVPPGLRNEPGALAAWRRERELRRGGGRYRA